MFKAPSRFFAILFFACSVSFTSAAESNTGSWLDKNAINTRLGQNEPEAKPLWFDATLLSLEGKPFDDTLTSYSRIPNRYKESVTKGVWHTGTHSAGLSIRFVSDSPEIHAIWNNDPPMNHMAWTGSGGLDLYAWEDDQWVFRAIGRPTTDTKSIAYFKPANQLPDPATPTEYLLFLPSYSKVDFLKVGIMPGTRIGPAPPRYGKKLPIVFYGTSITQGGCSSRPGMSHPALIRRWLDHPVLNLGFSGAGKCEPVMAELLAEIPSSLYIIETVSNMSPEMIRERVVPFVKNLREKRSDTPILMVESPNTEREPGTNAAFKTAYEQLLAENIADLHYLEGDKLYSGRENPTVDGSHPTDLGFYKMALAYENVIKNITASGKTSKTP